MSAEASHWARQQRVGHQRQKALLFWLGDFADLDGIVSKSDLDIANIIEATPAQVHADILTLGIKGFLTQQDPRGIRLLVTEARFQ